VAEHEPLLDPQVLARLMHLPLLSRQPMEGTVSGHHKSPHRGSSVEFAEYRNYVPGDDIRRLDWRVFARSDRFFIKEFEAETNLRCYLVLDCSGSMKFGRPGATKLDYAKRMAATLGYLASQQGDAIGLVCAGEKAPMDIPPRRNPAHLRIVFDILDKIAPGGETSLLANLHNLAEKAKRRALVIVISDFFCDLAPLLNCFQHLRFQKHDLALFQLLDRAELEFKFDRPTRFVDMESSFTLVTEPAVIRDEYLRQIHQFLELLRSGCHEFAADYRQVMTDQPYESALADFLIGRARAAAGS
jgi:uncharacterized protein (DUF58 family)